MSVELMGGNPQTGEYREVHGVIGKLARYGLIVGATVAAGVLGPIGAAGAQDFGASPGCGGGCPGGGFIRTLIGWIGQYSLWASFAAAIAGFGIWAWSRSQGGGYGMSKGQGYIVAGFAGIAGVSMAATIAQTLWGAAAGG